MRCDVMVCIQSATYCQLTLNRQLQAAKGEPSALPSDWIQNCINLSFYFTAQRRLRSELCFDGL